MNRVTFAGMPLETLTEPPSGSVVIASLDWVEALLTGSFATVIAIMAISLVGIQMLTGRIESRRILTVLFGAFILFGAPMIARGLIDVVGRDGTPQQAERIPPQPVYAMPDSRNWPSNLGNDPYAGAAVPAR
jgi:type IV secretion system protein VirB2